MKDITWPPYDPTHMTPLINLIYVIIGHISDINSVKFHPSGDAISTGSDDSTVRVYHLFYKLFQICYKYIIT